VTWAFIPHKIAITPLLSTGVLRLFSWFACGSENHELFVTQGHQGIDTGGATSGQVAGNQRNKQQNERYGSKRDCVGGAQAIVGTRQALPPIEPVWIGRLVILMAGLAAILGGIWEIHRGGPLILGGMLVAAP
jgi:hypothetical protein